MTFVAPRIVNNVLCVKSECYFSWQAQYLVKFGMIAGARNVVFFNTKCSWWA